jgi:hypothetical protein
MRPLIRLACGLAAGMLLLLAGASVAFAAEPLVIVDGSGGNSNDVSAGANTGTTSGTVTLGAQAPTSTADNADGSATVTLGAGAPNSTGDTDGSASVTLGSGSPTTADGADGSGTVTLGAGAPNSTGDTDGRADGSATFTFGAGSPNSIGDPSSSVGALSSGFASLIANGDSAAEDATGVAPGAPSTDGATFGLSQAFGSVLSSFGLAGGPGAPGGSGGSGSGNATAGASGDDTLPETSTGEFASGPGTDLPVLVLFLGLLAGGLAALRRTVRSAG